jgi:hypothetical protein
MSQRRIAPLRSREGRTVPMAVATGMVLAGSLLLGYVICLALVASNAAAFGVTSWAAVSAASGALLAMGTGIVGMAMRGPRAQLATCPIDAELWRIIDEETSDL